MNINTKELEITRHEVLADPSVLDMNQVGRCPIGLTLSRMLNRRLDIADKHHIPQLAQIRLNLDEKHFDELYRLGAWPEDLRRRWHEIITRREMMSHPQGHIASDAEERAQRAEIAAEVLQRFITINVE